MLAEIVTESWKLTEVKLPSRHLSVQIQLETPDQYVKYVQLWMDFPHCSGVSIDDFEQVNVCKLKEKLEIKLLPKKFIILLRFFSIFFSVY